MWCDQQGRRSPEKSKESFQALCEAPASSPTLVNSPERPRGEAELVDCSEIRRRTVSKPLFTVESFWTMNFGAQTSKRLTDSFKYRNAVAEEGKKSLSIGSLFQSQCSKREKTIQTSVKKDALWNSHLTCGTLKHLLESFDSKSVEHGSLMTGTRNPRRGRDPRPGFTQHCFSPLRWLQPWQPSSSSNRSSKHAGVGCGWRCQRKAWQTPSVEWRWGANGWGEILIGRPGETRHKRGHAGNVCVRRRLTEWWQRRQPSLAILRAHADGTCHEMKGGEGPRAYVNRSRRRKSRGFVFPVSPKRMSSVTKSGAEKQSEWAVHRFPAACSHHTSWLTAPKELLS